MVNHLSINHKDFRMSHDLKQENLLIKVYFPPFKWTVHREQLVLPHLWRKCHKKMKYRIARRISWRWNNKGRFTHILRSLCNKEVKITLSKVVMSSLVQPNTVHMTAIYSDTRTLMLICQQIAWEKTIFRQLTDKYNYEQNKSHFK